MKLEAVNLGKRFDREWVFRNIYWELEAGRTYALIGLNGAGKTTLLNLFAGLFAASEGDVYAADEPMRRESIEARRHIYFLPDFPIVRADWTLYRHLASLLVIQERDPEPAKAQFAELVKQFDLAKVVHKPFAQLSRGQIYKSALVCLKILSPQYWLLDEPFASGSDAHGLGVLKRMFRGHVGGGGTVVFSTQMPTTALAYADRIALLDRGECRLLRVESGQCFDDNGQVVDLESHIEESRCAE